MKILITGVAGFIGSNLATRLKKEEHEIIGIDNFSSGARTNIDDCIEFYEADIRTKEIYPYFKDVDYVFHLAAKNCLPDCLEDPVETAEINVVGTVNVLEAARRAGVKKIVYSDTSAEYEGILEFPSTEDEISPFSVYATSKNSGAAICRNYERFFDQRITIVRYFNVYGPLQDWRRSMPPLMSAFVLKLLKGERPIIYGDGEKRRDFIYVDDVTDFNIMAAFDERTDGLVCNVGSGVNYSVKEILEIVKEMVGVDMPAIFKDELPGEAEETLADISRSKSFGWEPRVDLREGLRRFIAFVEEENIIESSRTGGR